MIGYEITVYFIIKNMELTFWELTFWEVDILGVDILRVGILGVDVLRVDILGRTRLTDREQLRFFSEGRIY